MLLFYNYNRKTLNGSNGGDGENKYVQTRVIVFTEALVLFSEL